MTKKQFIQAIQSKRSKEGKETTGDFVDLVFNELKEVIKSGDNLNVIGLGTFSSKKVEARDMKLPMNGKTIHIPEHLSPKFTFSKKLKDEMK